MSDPPTRGPLGRSLDRFGQWVGQALGTPADPRPPPEPWALWRTACAGDEASATELVRRLTPQAYGLAMQLLARREDAEDAVQEAFVRLWGSRPSDTRGASLATFFNTIVINRCKSALTRRRELSADPQQLVEIADTRQRSEPVDTGGMPAFDAQSLQSAMARLPARQRMALAMWAYSDADVPEIARSLELDANAAHQLLHRAKTSLRQLLQEPKPHERTTP